MKKNVLANDIFSGKIKFNNVAENAAKKEELAANNKLDADMSESIMAAITKGSKK